MSDKTTTLKISADASGVEAGVETAKRSLKSLGDSAVRASLEAAKGLEGVGDGGEKAAKKVERATRGIVASLQEQIVALESGGRATVAYQVAMGNLKGVDGNALRPLLDRLEEVRVAQAKASISLAGGAASLDTVGISARQTAAALRGVPAQFTDIITSLQGGQAPLTVFLQQGGQLKDMFGGAGNAARALGGYVVGLVNPFTIAAAAVGTLAIAYHKGAEEARAFQNAATLTGGAIGVSSNQFAAMAQSISSIAGTRGKASEVLTEIASTGKLAGSEIKGIAEAAVLMEKATGQAVSKTVAEFVKLSEEPAKASIELNKQYNYLTTSVYEQIKALEDQGKKTQAAELAEKSYADALKTRALSVVDNAGLMEKAWRGVTGAAKGAWDAMNDVGRPTTEADKIGTLEKQLRERQERNTSLGIKGGAATQQIIDQIAALKETVRLEQKSAEATAERAKIQASGAAAVDAVAKANERAASKQEQLNKALREYRDSIAAIRAANPESALLDPKKIAAAEASIRDQFKGAKGPAAKPDAFLSDAARAYTKALDDLDKVQLTASASADKLSKTQEVLRGIQASPAWATFSLRKQEEVIMSASLAQAEEDRRAALDAAKKAQDAYNSSARDSANSIAKKLESLGDETRAYAIAIEKNISLAEAIDLVAIARLEEEVVRAKIANNDTGAKELEREIEDRKELAKLLRKKADNTAIVESGKAAAAATSAEWKRGWEETDRLGRQVWTDLTTQGENAADKIGKAFRTTVSSALYDVFAKPFLLQVYTSIAGNGGAGAAVQAASGAGNALSGGSNLLSGLSSLTGAFGSAASANFGATVSSFGSTIGLSIEGGLAAIAEGTGASIASGLGSIAGALGPVALGIGAALALKDAMAYKVEARGSGLTATIGGASGLPSGSVGMFREFQQTGGLGGGGTTINRDWSVADQGVANYITKSVQAITASNKAYANALGLTSGTIDSFTKNIEVNIDGLDAAGQQAAINAELNKFAAEQSAAAFGSATAAFAKEGETSTQTLQRLGGDLTSANAMFKSLGYALFDVSVTGAAAASKLIAAFGNVSEAASQIGSFQQNYFTQAERDSSTLTNAQASLQAAGLSYSIEQLVAATAGDIKAAVAQLAANAGTSDQAAAQYAAAVRAANAIASIKTATTGTPSSSTQAGGGFAMYSPEWYANGGAGGSTGGSDALLPSSSGGSAAVDSNIEAARSLQEQLDELTMSAVDLQKRQLAAQRELLNESNKLLFDAVQAAQLAKTNREYQDRIDVLTGKTTDRALSLQRDLAAAADASTQSLINMAYALEDMKTVSENAIAAAKDAYTSAQSGTDKAYAALERSVAAQKTVAQEAVTNAKAVIDSVGSAVKSLFSQVDSVVQSEAAKGVSFIDSALSAAQTTGYLPDPKDLNKAIGQATGGLDKQVFTSQADADFARLVLAGKLNALGDLAEPQLTAAEEQVKYLEGVLETARNQIDQLRGIDNSVKSVEEAIKALAAAMLAERAAKAASLIPKGGTVPLNPIGSTYVGMGSDIKTIQDLYSVNLGREGDTAGMAYWSQKFLADGVIDAAERQAFAIASLDEYRAKSRIGLAVGTNYVPYDGFKAELHKGEAVIPAAYNPAAGGSFSSGTGSTARMEALLTKLIERVTALEEPMAATAAATSDQRDLIDKVTEGGNGMRSEVMNKVSTVAA